MTGTREAQAIAANLGRDAKATRLRRRMTQAGLGHRVGLGQSEISYLERGHGARTSIETWAALGIALGRPIAIGFTRDVVDPLPRDRGHLEAQELVLRLAVAAGWHGRFEAASDPIMPSHSTDVRLTAPGRPMVLVEIWNRFDDLGAAVRSTDRKLADFLQYGDDPRAVLSCWLLVDTAANREIVRRYPAILRARFRGSSAGWVSAFTTGASGPTRPGIAWVDVTGHRLCELRSPGAERAAAEPPRNRAAAVRGTGAEPRGRRPR